jgi:hypothetical protein
MPASSPTFAMKYIRSETDVLREPYRWTPEEKTDKDNSLSRRLLEKPVKNPVFPVNPRKQFQKLKFWNSLK